MVRSIEELNLLSLDQLIKEEAWEDIGYYKNLSEDFLREHQDKLDWNTIFYSQILSLEFIKEFAEKHNPVDISNVNMSMPWIEEYQIRFNYSMIAKYQIIDLDFIKEKLDKLEYVDLISNPNLNIDDINTIYETYGDLL